MCSAQERRNVEIVVASTGSWLLSHVSEDVERVAIVEAKAELPATGLRLRGEPMDWTVVATGDRIKDGKFSVKVDDSQPKSSAK